MKVVYKNNSENTINIGGYCFTPQKELVSSVSIKAFDDAVRAGILSTERSDGSKVPKVSTKESKNVTESKPAASRSTKGASVKSTKDIKSEDGLAIKKKEVLDEDKTDTE